MTDSLSARLLELIAEAEDSNPDNMDLWIERGSMTLARLLGDEHPQVRRFRAATVPGLIKSPHTMQSGQFDAAQRKAIERANSILKAVEEDMRHIDQNEENSNSQGGNALFLVHGRDHGTTTEFRIFLRALNLRIVEWETAAVQTGETNPYVGDILEKGLSLADAIVVLFTPDDLARLREEFSAGSEDDAAVETGQPRMNVIYEAGMAQAMARESTVMVSIGSVRLPSDIGGRHLVRFDGSAESRNSFVGRLKNSGVVADTSGQDWLTVGSFD